MAKIEAVYLAPQDNGRWTVYDLEDGAEIERDAPMGISLIRVLAGRVRIAFIDSAYHVLASNGMFNLAGHDGIAYKCMDDGIPLVIMVDPPTIACYMVGKESLAIMDPANYGIVIDERIPVQQMIAYRKAIGFRFWPFTAVAAANSGSMPHAHYPSDLQTWSTIPEDSLIPLTPMGGNCGASFMGKCPGNAFHLYDIQGAYLAAARHMLPAELMRVHYSNDIDGQMWDRIAHVTVKTPCPMYPYRPANEIEGARKLTYYPIGEFDTILCGQELQMAADANHIAKVHRWEKWACEPFLETYSISMTRRIATCHPSIRSAVKTTALAGLGWFARKARPWEYSGQTPPTPGYCGDFFKLEESGVVRYRSFNGHCMREGEPEYHLDSSPQVWAWIAAAVRARLADVLRNLGKHVFYWDTDSVIVDSRGASIMEARQDFNVPGGWRKKGSASTMHVWGYRRYSFGESISIGLPVSSRDEAGGRFVWQSPETFDEAMGNRHFPDGTIVHRSARLRGTYQHGKICEDGRIVPFEISTLANEI